LEKYNISNRNCKKKQLLDYTKRKVQMEEMRRLRIQKLRRNEKITNSKDYEMEEMGSLIRSEQQ
jgi:hypothetical protein